MKNPNWKNAALSVGAAQASELACADDRRWFAENPGSDERVRPPFPGEFDYIGVPCEAVYVLSLAPDLRARVPIPRVEVGPAGKENPTTKNAARRAAGIST